MERGDHKSITTSNNVIFIWMDTKHVILASNYHEENEVALVSRRLKNGQRFTINCPQAVKDYHLFAHGVDLFDQSVSCYTSIISFASLFLIIVNFKTRIQATTIEECY